jgi:hypothetical protein
MRIVKNIFRYFVIASLRRSNPKKIASLRSQRPLTEFLGQLEFIFYDRYGSPLSG